MKTLSFFLSLFLLIGCNSHKEYKTVMLKTSGYVEISPNEATIILTARCIDQDIDKAKTCLINLTSKLNDDLKYFGIQNDDILTTGVNLSKDYIWRNNSQVFNGYRASTTTSVKVRDLIILDELYSKLLGNEKLIIGSLTYSHSKMDSINDIAYLKALENANRLADQILTKLPEKNKTITQISNFKTSRSKGNLVLNLEQMEESEEEFDNSKLTINTGKMIAVQHLFVEYKIY